MRNRWIRFEWSIAIILSVLLHGWLIGWMVRDEIRILADQLARGVKSDWSLLAHRVNKDELGEADGLGTAIAESAGEKPASGMEADMDQPFLSRDPVGMGKVGDAPSPYTGPTGGGPLSSEMRQAAAASAAVEQMPAAAPAVPPGTISPLVKSLNSNADESASSPAPIAKADPRAADSNSPTPPTAVAKGDSPTAQTSPRLSPNAVAKTDEKTPQAGRTDNLPKSNDPNAPAAAEKSSESLDRPSPAIAKSPPAEQPKASPTGDKKLIDPKALALNVPPRAQASRSPDKSQYQLAVPPKLAPEQMAESTPTDHSAQASPAKNSSASTAAASSPAAKAGLPIPSADPAPQSDSEIDPFVHGGGSVEFRSGKTVVRVGRKSKLTRPHIPLVGYWDGVAMGRAAVTLHLVIDPTGKVIKADVSESSGSNEIDNPICLEAYNWWFDPDKNAAGQPIKTEIPLTVCLFR